MSAINSAEEEIRAQMQEWFRTLAPGGNFISDLVPIDDPYYRILREEQDKFEAEYYHLT